MSALDQAPQYLTFLLTLCEERQNSNGSSVWHFRLADPRSGQRHSFATLDALVMALVQEMQDTNREN